MLWSNEKGGGALNALLWVWLSLFDDAIDGMTAILHWIIEFCVAFKHITDTEGWLLFSPSVFSLCSYEIIASPRAEV